MVAPVQDQVEQSDGEKKGQENCWDGIDLHLESYLEKVEAGVATDRPLYSSTGFYELYLAVSCLRLPYCR